MLITVPNLNDQGSRAIRLAALRFIIESAETVDNLCHNYLIVGDSYGTIDREQIETSRFDVIARELAELDAIVVSLWEYPLMESVTTEAHFGAETVERARQLARAIRQCVAEIAGTTPTEATDAGEVHDYWMHSVDCDRHAADVDCSKDCVRRSTEAGDGRPVYDVDPIVTTGQIAQIGASVIAGQPWRFHYVEVVSIDGDTLTYTTDHTWKSTVTRSEITGWDLTDFVVVSKTHAECRECSMQVEAATTQARVSGSVGATHSTTGIDGDHSATIARRFAGATL